MLSDTEEYPEKLEIVRDAFADKTGKRITDETVLGFIEGILVQSAADGRLNVVFNANMIDFSLVSMAEQYLSYFDRFGITVSLIIDQKPLPKPFELPLDVSSLPKARRFIQMNFLGFLNSSITFYRYKDQESIPNDLSYPIFYVGFPAPPINAKLMNDFKKFTMNRQFPIFDYKSLVRKRTAMERRNRDYLLQVTKTRQGLNERSNNAIEVIKKRERQFSVLEEKVQAISARKPRLPPQISNVESILVTIESNIDDLSTQVDELTTLFDQKAEGEQMSRHEELALLESLRSQITGYKQDIEEMKRNVQLKQMIK